ncbi:MAG: DUF1538 domain-containing protein [Bacilli bacterium]|nr:DUF1538 domain-containing protein [Bacilli bacterium]
MINVKFLRYLKEVFISSLPLLAIIVLVTAFIFPVTDSEQIMQLVVGYVGVVIGQAIFLVGLDYSVLPIGNLIGSSIAKLKKLAFILMVAFLFSLLATIAEPGITVLAAQVSGVSDKINAPLFIFIVSFGLGILTALAVYRLVKNISMKKIFFFFYLALIIIIFLVPNEFQALGFDASGAATGAISVPFVLALGVGLSHSIGHSKSTEESFGIVGIAAIGPIITVYIYGLIVGNSTTLTPYTPGNITFADSLLNNLPAVALAVFPLVLIFLIYQAFFIKLPRRKVLQILLATIVVFVGLYIFIVATDYGLAFAGSYIGREFMKSQTYQIILLPLSFVLGFAITLSEPSVVVFSQQVDEITSGSISKNVIKFALGISVGFAALLGVIKVITGLSILWFVVPLYVMAVGLIYFTPTLFVGLAFDGGTVSAGAITSAFLTPLTLGASQALGYENILTTGLGILAFISVMPRIVVQILGIIYNYRTSRQVVEYEDIEFDDDETEEGETSGT